MKNKNSQPSWSSVKDAIRELPESEFKKWMSASPKDFTDYIIDIIKEKQKVKPWYLRFVLFFKKLFCRLF